MSLNDPLPLGPVHLPLWLVAAALAALVLKLVLKFVLTENARKWEESLWNAALVGFVLWKLSPLISSWDQIAKEPMSLLYLPGNALGLGAAVASAGAWLGWKLWKDRTNLPRVLRGLGIGLGASAASVFLLGLLLSLVPSPKPELPAHSLILNTLEGGSQAVALAPGKVLFVNFWATWCPPCRAEIPEFVRFWGQANPAAVAIQAIDLAASEQDPASVPGFVRSEGMRFPVLLDTAGEAAATYRIESIPTTLVFDGTGKLVFRHTGAMTRDMMEALVLQYGR